MQKAANSTPISQTASIFGLSFNVSGKWSCMLVSCNSLANLFIGDIYGPNIDPDQLTAQIR
jgi:hypothetical protein